MTRRVSVLVHMVAFIVGITIGHFSMNYLGLVVDTQPTATAAEIVEKSTKAPVKGALGDQRSAPADGEGAGQLTGRTLNDTATQREPRTADYNQRGELEVRDAAGIRSEGRDRGNQVQPMRPDLRLLERGDVRTSSVPAYDEGRPRGSESAAIGERDASPKRPELQGSRETQATEEAARLNERTRPIRPAPQIVRLTDYHCVVVAPNAIGYRDGSIQRPISAPFPCPACMCNCRPAECDGSQQLLIEYRDGELVSVPRRIPR